VTRQKQTLPSTTLPIYVRRTATRVAQVERIYQNHYETRAQARLDIVDWIEGYYNRQRLHTSIDFLTPVDYEASLIAA
ncbi:IS3 family transposase, partial [Burkholderia sp. Bp8986]|uniref:IS3 family transposase n=1 Tax=Burkholderia sp. Bp8986 TaxID=2184550 RepID=UPI0021AB92DE